MEYIYLESPGKIKQNLEVLERKLNVKIKMKGRQLNIEGEPVDEFEARTIIEAMDFGFPLGDAMKLTDENMVFRKIPIKQFTRRKDLEEVRGRVIGTEGKTKRTVEEVSGCAVVVHNNMVGIIGLAENIEEATTAITNLIKGSKQANVYRFLEKMNTSKKEKTDLGLKDKDKGEKEEEDKEDDDFKDFEEIEDEEKPKEDEEDEEDAKA